MNTWYNDTTINFHTFRKTKMPTIANPLDVVRKACEKHGLSRLEIDRETYEEKFNGQPPTYIGRDRFVMAPCITEDFFMCFWFDRVSQKYYVTYDRLTQFLHASLDTLRKLPYAAS